MSRFIDLSNPAIIHAGRDKFGNGIYHIPHDLPTVDAVEVVRCKDCKYYRESFPYNTCAAFEPVLVPDEYDFCSYGERKETVNGSCIQ